MLYIVKYSNSFKFIISWEKLLTFSYNINTCKFALIEHFVDVSTTEKEKSFEVLFPIRYSDSCSMHFLASFSILSLENLTLNDPYWDLLQIYYLHFDLREKFGKI